MVRYFGACVSHYLYEFTWADHEFDGVLYCSCGYINGFFCWHVRRVYLSRIAFICMLGDFFA
uniref:SWIM zinc finger family protein n=1 Tax=Lentilactobacillus parafarraginis TaxID=390842 RepID=UPI001CDBC8C0